MIKNPLFQKFQELNIFHSYHSLGPINLHDLHNNVAFYSQIAISLQILASKIVGHN